MLRKEGIVFLCIVSLLLFMSASLHHIFNALALFYLAGIIPGTEIRLPSSYMFGLSLFALLLISVWPFREAISKSVRIGHKHSRQPSA